MVSQAIDRSRLILKLAPWDSLDDDFSSRIPMDSPTEAETLLREMIESKTATLYRLENDNRRIGLLIVRIEEGSLGRELVIIAVFGYDRQTTLTPEISAAIDELAKAQNCVTSRFHTCRHGLAKVACDSLGYRITEIVLRKNYR